MLESLRKHNSNIQWYVVVVVVVSQLGEIQYSTAL